MNLPDPVRVRISSERADAISMMPVVVQDMHLDELMEHIVGVAGKDPARVSEILARGTLTSGASRLRWDGISIASAELQPRLASFPDSDAGRPFLAAACTHAVFRIGPTQLTLPRDMAAKRRLFRRRSFWDVLMERATSPEYIEYSYREKADVYRVRLSFEDQTQLAEAAVLLPFPTIAAQVRSASLDTLELFVKR